MKRGLVTESGFPVNLGGYAAASSFIFIQAKDIHVCQFILEMVFSRLDLPNATARWTVACRRVEVGNSLIGILIGNPNITNLDTRTMKYSKKLSPQLAFALLWAAIAFRMMIIKTPQPQEPR